jgi:hypothetical protein
MACGPFVSAVTTWVASLLWWWLVVQFAYWTVVWAGIRRFARFRALSDDRSHGISLEVVIPAYNEKQHLFLIGELLKEARQAGIRAFLVDDGSTDCSADCLIALCRRLNANLLTHSTNRGKAAALQSGLRSVTAPYAMLVDADTHVPLPPKCRAITDPNIGAVAFTIAAAEDGRRLVAIQAAEYEYILRVCPKTSGGITKFSEHEAD